MHIIRNILCIALGLMLQSTLAGRMEIFGVRPDIGILVLVLIAGSVSTAEATLYGFLIGFVQDAYSPEYLGSNALAMSLTGFMLGMFREMIAVENCGMKAAITLLVCLVHDLVYLAFYTKLDLSLYASLFITGSLAGAAYTAFLAFLVIAAYEWSVGGGLRVVLRELTGFRR